MTKQIALASDEFYPYHQELVEWLASLGINLKLFASFNSKTDEPWVYAISEAAKAVSEGECDEGIFFCYSGTGASIVANKFKNIRAALCRDDEIAKLARVWNHANVIVLSNKDMDFKKLQKILTAWFEPYDNLKGGEEIEKLKKL